MIVTNINVSKENLDTIFMKHRDGIDPENYRVGVYNDNVYVLNPDTNVTMEYYYDDIPEKEWFDISYYYKVKDGKVPENTYFINREGILYSKFYKRNLKINSTELYPNYGIKLFESVNRTAHSKRAQIHILLADIFIPNPDPKNKIVVDHKDKDKYNYSLSNLRWFSISENNSNKDVSPYKGNYTYYAYKDKELTELVFTLTEEELYNHPTIHKERLCKAFDSISSKFRHYGYYWRRENNRILSYLKNVGIDELDDSLWKETRYKGVFAHPVGLIKNRKGDITEGCSGAYINYLSINILDGDKYSNILMHIIIAETFLNDNKPLPEGMEVDHISTNPRDNRVENLRICSHPDNMGNPETRKKLSRRVLCLKDGIVHNSIQDCVKYYRLKTRHYVYNNPDIYKILDPKKK